VIKLDGIEVTYGRGTENQIRALHIPSLEIEPGCWCNVIGPNGSGKTTLLKILSGGIDSFNGQVFIQGSNVSLWKTRHLSKMVQLLEQSPEKNIIPSMSIEENLRLYSRTSRFPSISSLGKEGLDRIEHMLSRFEMKLETRLFSQVGLLSGGQKQAVALAAVLLRNPKVLLLDEFLASIDPKASPKLLSVVREAAREKGITVVMVSHNLAHAETTGNRLIILANGRVEYDLSATDHPLSRSKLVTCYSTVLERNGIL